MQVEAGEVLPKLVEHLCLGQILYAPVLAPAFFSPWIRRGSAKASSRTETSGEMALASTHTALRPTALRATRHLGGQLESTISLCRYRCLDTQHISQTRLLGPLPTVLRPVRGGPGDVMPTKI
jgi:hypothetical protein